MTLHVHTTAEKLDEVERLLRVDPRNEVLKGIAADLRARLEGSPSAALVTLERVIVAAARAKTPVGYPHNHLVQVAEHVLGRWSLIKQALERFGAEIENPKPCIHEARTF